MNPYRVIASNSQTAIVALEDAKGRVHLGRTLVEPPLSGTPLAGAAPAIGMLALRFAVGDDPLPFAMVILDCDPEDAVKLVELAEPEAPIGSAGRRVEPEPVAGDA